jgi:GrpB-like predicted nucleotidyltransferase (UPF0157 family)
MHKRQRCGRYRIKLPLLAGAAIGKGIEDIVTLKIRWLQRGEASHVDFRILARVHKAVLRRLQTLRTLGKTIAAELEERALGVHSTKVHLVAHDHGWAGIFRDEAGILQRGLDGHGAGIHHIGSTSIPGLPSKPIIDIAISLPEKNFDGHLAACRKALEGMGYRYLGNRGRSGGQMFEKESAGVRTHAIQVHPLNSPGLEETLRFKQMLLNDTDLACEYAEIKVALAQLFPRQRLIYVWYKSHWLRHRLLDDNDDQAWGRWLISAQIPTIQRILFRSLRRFFRKR